MRSKFLTILLFFTQMTYSQSSIKLFHIRHATSIIEINNKKILIDPMLSAKDSLPTVSLAENKLKNPRTDLPLSADSIVKNIDYLLLTHLHFDHFDSKAIQILSKQTPILCSKPDVKQLTKLGFSRIHTIDNEFETDSIKITQFPATHGKGFLKNLMGKGSSYLIEYKGFKIFLTGDGLLTDSLKNILTKTKPDIVIANAGAAKLKFGKPITMSIKDIQEISKILSNSKIFVVHLDALNHCSESRKNSQEQLVEYPNIYLPADGEEIIIK